jgi:hypothetical protein
VAARPQPPGGGWLVAPGFDLFFLANLWWPLVAVAGWWIAETDSWFGFWQIYFLTTPHRWLTLILVAADPDRRANKMSWLIGIAVVTSIVVFGVWSITGALYCLAVVDYIWNAWHFGAQHGGIARMYARRAGEATSLGQTWGLRVLVVYTALRMAGWSTGWLELTTIGPAALAALDAVMGTACVAAIYLPSLFRARSAFSTVESTSWGRPVYVASVVALYLALLVAVNLHLPALITGLVAGSAGFHAIEYLAIVTFYAQRRKTHGSAGAFQTMAKNWSALLGLYIIALGAMAFATDRAVQEIWLGVNLWGAFLHYAYDGMIWKLREAKTSQTLGVQLAAKSGGVP